MRRGSAFFRRNQYKIAAVCVLAAVLGLAGVYMFAGHGSEEEQPQQTAMEETEEIDKKVVAQKETKEEKQEEKEEKEEDGKKAVIASTVIKPKDKGELTDVQTKIAQADSETDMETDDQQTEATSAAPAIELHFDAETGLLWPVEGSVILGYSMDQTVYFTTLDQYKYNPAVIISGNVNDKVKAAANGRITDISTNEVTGCTVTMDLGDGYTAIYGQLKEVPYEAGAYLEAGNTIGFVSEPTKYYALEGSNVYFALEKDEAPVNPIEFFQ